MGSSISPSRKLGSSMGGGGGATTLGAGAAGADASAAGADAVVSGADAASSGVLAASAGTSGVEAGACGAVGVAGTPGTSALIAAGVLAAGAVAGAAPAAEAAPTLFRSLMFLDSSAMRALASLACLSLASWSSAAFWPLREPFERVSLSGAAVAGLRSSTWACTLPLAERSAEATVALGAASANLRRKVLKSRLWAARIWRASVLDTDLAVASSGICSTEPARTRFTLPWMNASGLARIMATSIWSRETSAGRWAFAMRPAVSPGLTVTPSAGAGRDAAGARTAGAAGVATRAGTGRCCAAAAGTVIWGAAVAVGAALRNAGGSSSRV